MSKVKFYLKHYQESLPESIKYPALVLVPGSWDDYTYKITFRLFLYQKENRINIGEVKILEKSAKSPTLKDSFFKIKANQCSLGQSISYYEKLKKYFPDSYLQILYNLNDIALNRGIRERFENERGYKDGLLRFASAEKMFSELRVIFNLDQRIGSSEYFFEYSRKLPNASSNHTVKFDFRKNQYLPYRINVWIGKNGTGKTQLLGSMVNTLSGVGVGSFSPTRPLFNGIIAISYSLFDKFPVPRTTKSFAYKYIGIRNSTEENNALEIIDDFKINSKLKSALKEVINLDRYNVWYEFVNEIIPLINFSLVSNNERLTDYQINKIAEDRQQYLSSGQSIILFMLTELIANIQPESLILYDEPETHLHPSALAQLIRTFYKILQEYDSYAVIATHSPIVLQDIPSQYVTVFDREGNFPIMRELPLESFGENVSFLTRSIFETVSVKELYREHFEELVRNRMSLNSIKNLFDKDLSLNAQIMLAALLERKAE